MTDPVETSAPGVERDPAVGRGAVPAPVIAFTLGDETYEITPTFRSLSRIEAALGLGLAELRVRIIDRQYGAIVITRIIYEGLKVSLDQASPKYSDLGERIVKAGIDNLVVPALEFVQAGLEGLENFATEPPPLPGDPEAEEGSDPPDPMTPQAE